MLFTDVPDIVSQEYAVPHIGSDGTPPPPFPLIPPATPARTLPPLHNFFPKPPPVPPPPEKYYAATEICKVSLPIYFHSFKYHVLCTDGKISVKINLLFYLFFHRRPIQQLCVSFLYAFFQQVLWVLKFLLSPGLNSKIKSRGQETNKNF